MAVRTRAGAPGTSGMVDGAAGAARFNCPYGVAFKSDGSLVVADSNNHRIRLVSVSGEVTTLAGNGTASSVDGAGWAASFDDPSAVAVACDGSVYVTEYQGERVRRIDPNGMVSTLAGTGATGGADGPSQVATFDGSIGVAVDGEGNLLVSEYDGHRIRRITPNGDVSTFAGSGAAGFANGLALEAQFNGPRGLAIGPEGQLFVADYNNNCIRVVANGIVSTVAGSGTAGFLDAQGLAAQFNCPAGVAVDAHGTLVVADGGNHRLRLISPSGQVSTLAGNGTASPVDGNGASATFNHPCCTALHQDGLVAAVDFGGHCLRIVKTQLGPPSLGSLQLRAELPSSMAADLLSLLGSSESSDVVFLVGGERICGHKALLSARSDYFAAMFRSKCTESQPGAEVSVPDASVAAFRAVLAFLYSDELNVDDAVLVEVAQLSQKYDIKRLHNHCFNQVLKNLTPSNAIRNFMSVRKRKNGLEDVDSGVLAFIKMNFKRIKAEAPETLKLLYAEPTLGVELLSDAA